MSALAGKAASSHTHAIADTTGLQAALDAKAATNRKLDDFGAPDDNTDLNATTSAHGLLPKLGGGTTDFLRADGTWAAPAGGDSIALPLQAWIETSANGGSDASGQVGNPTKPFETWGAAYTAGARVFNTGAGTFAGLNLTGNVDVAYRGLGPERTIISALSTSGGNLTAQDLGCHSALVSTLACSGVTAREVHLHNALIGTASLDGAAGGLGTSGSTADSDYGGNGGVGGDGGYAATLYVHGHVIIDTLSGVGGPGGEGGVGADGAEVPGNGGDGGPGGQSMFIYPSALGGTLDNNNLTVGGGSGGNGGSSGSGGGSIGIPGSPGAESEAHGLCLSRVGAISATGTITFTNCFLYVHNGAAL